MPGMPKKPDRTLRAAQQTKADASREAASTPDPSGEQPTEALGEALAQEQDRLAIAFNNEVGPVVEAMEARIAELEAWVDAKYAEWHRLLEELFEVEAEINRATL